MASLLKTARVPLATYRLQLRADFGFDEVRRLTSYLRRLGVSDAYLSPLFHAREQSEHGYDVVNHKAIEPSFGGEAGIERLAGALREREMGLLLDVVPNHMGVHDAQNVWWQDVLENGEGARCARHFDIDWNPPAEKLRHKVLLPILGDSYGNVLERQELKVVHEDRRFCVQYFDRRFPLTPSSWSVILRLLLEKLPDDAQRDDPNRMELESIIGALEKLPPRTSRDPEHLHERYREQEVASRRLHDLLERSPTISDALQAALVELNGQAGDPRSFDRLDELLDQQAYRLSWWRTAVDEINYRRFFDINELAAVRVEEPEVFTAVHELVFRMLCKGWVTGLRIDHPDGLYDPTQYFENLQKEWRRSLDDPECETSRQSTPHHDLYVVAEKILAHDEVLRPDWSICGTTGYYFLNLVNGLFVRREGVEALRAVYRRFTGLETPFSRIIYESKKAILNYSMSSELHVLAWRLSRLAERNRVSRDFTLTSLVRALGEVIACFPVYRTYVRPSDVTPGDEDIRRIMMAVRLAKIRNTEMSWAYFDFIASVLLLEEPAGAPEDELRERREFALKFQQVTGPVTAKGLEDTAFYRYFPLASLNEVGGEPSSLGVLPEEFHRVATHRVADWPNALSATSTHDAKRGEDLRARLNVLSEIPEVWQAAVHRWSELNQPCRGEAEGEPIPSLNEEYLLYQTLVGAWPLDADPARPNPQFTARIRQYMQKALREAKMTTSWLNVSEAYEATVFEFIERILDPAVSPRFLQDLDALVRDIAGSGFLNSLSQTLVKICAPGVPDFYQGSELWEFSLVDPDNRRPVDFAHREKLLAELERQAAEDLPGLAAELLASWPDPRIKMFVIWRSLLLRRRLRDVFLDGDYLPLAPEGSRADHVAGFARRKGDRWVVAAVPRFARLLGDDPLPAMRAGWEKTRLPLPDEAPPHWRCAFTARRTAVNEKSSRALKLPELFSAFPLILLESE
jgi:(1->4)-alpha-D-glucan 1-alpha-D-glucosylmutase